MSHFTQLNLSGTPERKPQGKSTRNTSEAEESAFEETKFSGEKKAAAFLGWLAVTSLLGVALLEAGGCSKGARKSGTLKSDAVLSQASSSLPVTASTTTAEQRAAQRPSPKTSRQHRLSAATYNNPAYGVSFRYPKHDTLKEGDKANLEWTELGPVEMNFIQTGGTTLAAVELPRGLDPSTNFTSAFFNLSVNPNLTRAQCRQFRFPESNPAEGNAEDGSSAASEVELSKVKLGTAEFTEVEQSAGAATQQADAKYYHLYGNGTCYEFVLGLETAADGATDGTKPVDRNVVFRKLNWILSTVKITPAGVPATTDAEVAAPTPAAAGEGGKN